MPLNYLPEEEQDDLSSPYSSITDREPLEDVSMLGKAQALMDDGDDLSISPEEAASMGGSAPPVNPVFDAIKQRRMPGLPKGVPSSPASLLDYSNDPLMQDYNKREMGLKDYRAQKINSDKIQNITQAALMAARGPNAVGDSDALFSNMSKQGDSLLKSNEEDMDRRQKIVNAIEGRKSRELIASEGAKNRAAMFQASQGNKNKNRGVQINRILGMTEKELREDPISKPSELNLASLEKARSILENRTLPLTSQVLSDVEQDIASGMQLRGLGASEGKIKRTELDMMGRKIAEAKQKYLNKIVDLRVAEPELVALITKVNHALTDDYKTTIAQRKNSILDDKMAIWGDDPDYANKLNSLRASVNKRHPIQKESPSSMAKNAPPPGGISDPVSEGGIFNSANAGGPKTKTIGNDTYMKVDGGWQLVQPDGSP